MGKILEEKNMSKVNILGLNISQVKKEEVLETVRNYLQEDKGHYLVTPNPEIILKATEDEELFYIINHADLAPPDGAGLFFAGLLMGKILRRYPGSDLSREILNLARENNLRVVLVNSSQGLTRSGEIRKKILQKFPGLDFKVITVNPYQKKGGEEKLKSLKPQILLAGLGAPYQEKFIFHNLEKIPDLRFAMGVGGSLDFLADRIARAPQVFRFLGLEWLWRLLKQPNRARRIFRAVIVFPLRFLEWRLILPWLYRPNVACLLYKKEGNNYKILLVERKGEKGHWQLPQGGAEGEDLITAGSRELSEEVNCDCFEAITSSKNLKKYRFEKKGKEITKQKHWGYKGQKQGLFIAKFTGKDEDISVNFWEHSNWRWVDWKNLKQEIHPVRRDRVEDYLKIFSREVVRTEN